MQGIPEPRFFCQGVPAAIPYGFCLRGLMQGIPEPCFFNYQAGKFHAFNTRGGAMVRDWLFIFWGVIIRILFGFYSVFIRDFHVSKTQGSESLAYALKGIKIGKEACSNSLLFMPLRPHAWHHLTLLFKGGPQQFLNPSSYNVSFTFK